MNKSDLTAWFDGVTTKPTRIGVYQRKMDSTVVRYAYWGGTVWFLSSDSNRDAEFYFKTGAVSRTQDGFEWRGLRRKP